MIYHSKKITKDIEMYNVLYVDDEPVLLELGKLFLNTRWGFSVSTAISANEALFQLNSNIYDVIISDYEMPGMDGISFLKHLRSNNFSEPFILFTGKGREEVVIEALNNGADFYLQKGGDAVSQFSELVNMINRAVERRRAEDKLNQANSRSLAIINHLPDPTFVVNERGEITSWNYAMEKMTGESAQDVIGKSANEIFYKIYNKDNISLINSLINPGLDIHSLHNWIENNGTTITAETRVTDKNGKQQFLWAKVSSLLDNDMQLSGAIETIRDITAIKKTESEIREINNQLHNIINFIPDPTFVIDNKGIVIAWNHAFELLTGYEASSMIGKGDYSYAIPFYGKKRPILIDLVFMDLPEIREKYINVNKEGEAIKAEVYIPDLKGRNNVYLWGIASPLYDTCGNLTGAIESIRDITSKKELELELKQKYEELAGSYEEIAAQNTEIRRSYDELIVRETLLLKSERKFRSLIENMHYGVIIYSDGIINYVNPVAADILGYNNPDELIGVLALDLVNPGQREYILQKMANTTPSQQLFIDGILLRKDGFDVPVEIARVTVNFDDTKSVMIIFRDISEESNQRIHLHQTRKKLDVLSSITRHDIKNQVDTLMTVLDLFSDAEMTDPTSSLLNTAHLSCNNILNSLKTSVEYQALGVKEPCWFSVKPLINQAAQSRQMSNKISYNGVGIEIYADSLIEKVFENLIENSIRHGGEINKISFNTINHSGDLLLIYQDDGSGIPDEEKRLIFKEGYGKDTGLGLFLISEILSVTDITIRECGKFGEGAMFEIRVPHGKWRYYE